MATSRMCASQVCLCTPMSASRKARLKLTLKMSSCARRQLLEMLTLESRRSLACLPRGVSTMDGGLQGPTCFGIGVYHARSQSCMRRMWQCGDEGDAKSQCHGKSWEGGGSGMMIDGILTPPRRHELESGRTSSISQQIMCARLSPQVFPHLPYGDAKEFSLPPGYPVPRGCFALCSLVCKQSP